MMTLESRWLAMLAKWPHPLDLGTVQLAYDDKAAAQWLANTDLESWQLWSDNRDATETWLVQHWMQWLWRHNQFIVIDENAKIALRTQAQQLLATPLTAVSWRHHRRQLAEQLRAIVGDDLRTVVASNYSAKLIVRVLGLADKELQSPALDIGAGNGSLLRYLHGRGVDAVGFDRLAADRIAIDSSEYRTDSVHQGDWLGYDYDQRPWRLITSHHGFSLFFARADRLGQLVAADYARTYMRIITALASGGIFAYYPALPFIERLLPARQYLVTSKALPADLALSASATDPYAEEFSTHVLRV
jgi:hypothetical protein